MLKPITKINKSYRSTTHIGTHQANLHRADRAVEAKGEPVTNVKISIIKPFFESVAQIAEVEI